MIALLVGHRNASVRCVASRALGNIAAGGAIAHLQALIDADLIPATLIRFRRNAADAQSRKVLCLCMCAIGFDRRKSPNTQTKKKQRRFIC